MSRCETFEDQIEQNFQNIKNGSLIFAWDFDPHDTPFIVVAKKENDKIYAKIKETNSGAIVPDGYRKQSDTVREFVERLKSEYLSKEGDFVYWVIDVDDIAKVAKEYGVEVEE